MSRSHSRGRSHTVVPASNRAFAENQQLISMFSKALQRYCQLFTGCNVTLGDVRSDLVFSDAEDVLIQVNVSHLPNVGHLERYLTTELRATCYLQLEQELSGTKAIMRHICHIDRDEFQNGKPQWSTSLRRYKKAIFSALLTFFLLYFFMFVY